MKLQRLKVHNFRAIEDVEIEFTSAVNVLVGPNAIGKSTLLEAIRLAKALIAPRTSNESLQTLISLGAVSPHMPQRLFPQSIARKPGPVVIKCTYKLDSKEVQSIEDSIPLLATNLVQSRMGQQFANAASLSAYLSSPVGKQALESSERELNQAVKALHGSDFACRLDLTIDFVTGRVDSGDIGGSAFIAFLDQRNPTNLTCFSYFPADRALPSGEQPVQIGIADAPAQMESHNSQPQTKYARLKNTVFNAVITSDESRAKLEADFANIFSGVLRGRSLIGAGINELGLLSIQVKDNESGNSFGLDAMSSGEKGLILTCLLLSQSIVDGGVVLLDEPELHLNPAVCKSLLGFLIKSYVKPKNLQLIVCSHSPEILGGAIESDDCALYHVISSTMVSQVRKRDSDEVTTALACLGTSESEGLLYRATIFVEGDEDVDLLEAGFSDTLRRFKLKDLGGRKEVEKQIVELQRHDDIANGARRYFIFDRDNAPTGLKNSNTVRVLQWDRRCLENYLIDTEALTELLKDPDLVKRPLKNQGEVSKKLIDLAKGQMDEFIARQVYSEFNYESPGWRTTELKNKPLDGIADLLYLRLAKIRAETALISDEWKTMFLERCAARRKELEPVWDADWKDDCDGKKLFADLHQEVGVKISLRKFKRRVMSEMRETPPSQNWRAVESLLKSLIGEESVVT